VNSRSVLRQELFEIPTGGGAVRYGLREA